MTSFTVTVLCDAYTYADESFLGDVEKHLVLAGDESQKVRCFRR